MGGKTAIVTGAASGIGVETACALAGAGAAVTLAVRDTTAGDRVAAGIRESTGSTSIDVGALDLSDLSSVAAFVRAWNGPLDILVNNAGVMAVQELTMSPSGHELQFATNHLGHFALAVGLHDALAEAKPARIVSVSSSGHLRSPAVFDDIDFAFRDDPFGAYLQFEDCERLVRRRGDPPLGRRRHHLERVDARRDPDRATAPPLSEYGRRPKSGSDGPGRG